MGIKKQLIINADDFGKSEAVNKAVFIGYKDGNLTSASLMANAPAFYDAVSMLDELNELSIGVHLNVIEFSTLKKQKCSLLCDKNGRYKNGFITHLIKSFDNNYIDELEEDFRLQIEKISQITEITHIDSHVHVHAIPNIFKLVCKLAKEYGIKNIRTQFEYPYFVPDIKKYLSPKYPLNWIKLLLLNSFTEINRRELEKYSFITNKNIIGVNYTGYMDSCTIKYALPHVKELTEAILHPSCDIADKTHYNEFLALMNGTLKEEIKKQKINICGWNKLM